MPEGPEVKYSVDMLRQITKNKIVKSITGGGRYSGMLFDADNVQITNIFSHGKFSWWETQNSNINFAVTYGMSGQWFSSEKKHTAIAIHFSDDTCVFFNDPRHFGTFQIVDQVTISKKLKKLGPCILQKNEPIVYLQHALKKPNRTLAEVIMDQSVFSGAGNYIKSEALFSAGLLPTRILTDISGEQWKNLVTCIEDIAYQAYKNKGASIYTYVDPIGEKGRAQFEFKVYNKEKCPKGHVLHRMKTADERTSHWCEQCQN